LSILPPPPEKKEQRLAFRLLRTFEYPVSQHFGVGVGNAMWGERVSLRRFFFCLSLFVALSMRGCPGLSALKGWWALVHCAGGRGVRACVRVA
jgi:hypothetical protein